VDNPILSLAGGVSPNCFTCTQNFDLSITYKQATICSICCCSTYAIWILPYPINCTLNLVIYPIINNNATSFPSSLCSTIVICLLEVDHDFFSQTSRPWLMICWLKKNIEVIFTRKAHKGIESIISYKSGSHL